MILLLRSSAVPSYGHPGKMPVPTRFPREFCLTIIPRMISSISCLLSPVKAACRAVKSKWTTAQYPDARNSFAGRGTRMLPLIFLHNSIEFSASISLNFLTFHLGKSEGSSIVTTTPCKLCCKETSYKNMYQNMPLLSILFVHCGELFYGQ